MIPEITTATWFWAAGGWVFGLACAPIVYMALARRWVRKQLSRTAKEIATKMIREAVKTAKAREAEYEGGGDRQT